MFSNWLKKWRKPEPITVYQRDGEVTKCAQGTSHQSDQCPRHGDVCLHAPVKSSSGAGAASLLSCPRDSPCLRSAPAGSSMLCQLLACRHSSPYGVPPNFSLAVSHAFWILLSLEYFEKFCNCVYFPFDPRVVKQTVLFFQVEVPFRVVFFLINS